MVARPPRDSNQLSMSLIPAQGSLSPTVASLASLKLATLVTLHSNLSRLKAFCPNSLVGIVEVVSTLVRLHLNYPDSRLIWPNYSIVGIVEVDNSGSSFRYWSFKMKSIVLITYEIIWRCVQPLIVVGIAVKKKISDTVSSSKFKSRIQFLPLGERLPMAIWLLEDIGRAIFSVWYSNRSKFSWSHGQSGHGVLNKICLYYSLRRHIYPVGKLLSQAIEIICRSGRERAQNLMGEAAWFLYKGAQAESWTLNPKGQRQHNIRESALEISWIWIRIRPQYPWV